MNPFPESPKLTQKEAYLAMYAFLAAYYERGPSDEIGGLLGSLSLLEGNVPADAAMADDWAAAAARAMEGKVDAQLRLKR